MKLIQFTKPAKKQYQPKVSERKECIKIKTEIKKLDNRQRTKLIALEVEF